MNMTGEQPAVILTILGAAAATYAMRLGGLLLAGRLPRDGGFQRFMEALPGAILLSLVVPGVLSAGPWGWAGALATAFCARKTGNLFLAMGLGVAIVALGRQV
jgi:uncharacterized membrane protein